MQTDKDEGYGKYGLNLLDLTSDMEQLSVDDQVALSPTSSRAPTSNAGSSESQAPSFVESPPLGKSADTPWGLKTSSRASSAEHTAPGSEVSSFEEDDSEVSQADVVSLTPNGPVFDLTDDIRTGINLTSAKSNRPLFPKVGRMILRTSSHSTAHFAPMIIV